MSLLPSWLNAGVQHRHLVSASHIRLSNIIAVLFVILLFLQLGLCIQYWTGGGKWQVALILSHAIFCPAVPLINHYLRPFYGRWLLILLFISYIFLTSLHLGNLTQTHDFLLLSLFLCPFLFAGRQKAEMLLAIVLLIAGFAVIELNVFSPLTFGMVLPEYQEAVAGYNRVSFILAAFLAAYLIHQDHYKSWQSLATEQQRSERLLLNILPRSIAERLQTSTELVADHFNQATVIFADIENFSDISKTRSPAELVRYLNAVYSAFDDLLKHYGLEKIKTNGDEYMAVCGVPEPLTDHAQRSCQCAIAMRQTFNDISQRHGINNGLRIGVNSGELIAGVIGKHKFSYDLWGENVNLASRMESQGSSQQIQVAEATYRLCKQQFEFICKGDIEVKGMGTQRVYWLAQQSHQDQSASLSANA